jgi:hypothetical protein
MQSPVHSGVVVDDEVREEIVEFRAIESSMVVSE